MIKAIFFDFDMTLINSFPLAKRSYKEISKLAGMKISSKGFEDYVGRRVSESLDFFSKDKPELRKAFIKLFLKIHISNPSKIQVFGKEALKYLKKKGIKVVIISRNSREVIKKVARTHKLHYDLIIADEDMAFGEEKHQAILHTLKKLKLKKSEIYYVGDHINDVKEAHKAGVKVISVTTGVSSAKDLIPFKPEFILADLNDLRKII